MTAEFDSAWLEAGSPVPSVFLHRLRRHKVIFAPGFMSRMYTEPLNIMGMEFRMGSYFDDQLNWLKTLEITNRRLELTPGGFFEKNAERLAELIRDSEYPVILIAHSRGGLDALEALRKLPPLLGKTAGVITIQSPFYGTPVADYFEERDFLKTLSAPLLKSAGETPSSVYWLTTGFRNGYMERHAREIAEIVKAVPFICVGSSCGPDGMCSDASLNLASALLRSKGVPQHDGLVPIASTRLPGAHFVEAGEIDHRMPVTSSPGETFDRIRFVRALLAVLIKITPAD